MLIADGYKVVSIAFFTTGSGVSFILEKAEA